MTCIGKEYSNRIKRTYALHKVKVIFVCEFFFFLMPIHLYMCALSHCPSVVGTAYRGSRSPPNTVYGLLLDNLPRCLIYSTHMVVQRIEKIVEILCVKVPWAYNIQKIKAKDCILFLSE